MPRLLKTQEQRDKANAYAKEWYQNNKEKAAATSSRWRKNHPEQRKQIVLRWQRNNPYKMSGMQARRRGLSWGISPELYTSLKALPCYGCGGPIADSVGGLDRIDNSRGYEPDNVLPCCYQCKVTRSDFYTVEELKVMIQALQEHRKKAA